MRARTDSEPVWQPRPAAPSWLAVAPRAVESSFLKSSIDGGRLTGDSAAHKRLTLPAQKRLRRKSDFDATYARGRRFGNGFFGVTAVQNDIAVRVLAWPLRFESPVVVSNVTGFEG